MRVPYVVFLALVANYHMTPLLAQWEATGPPGTTIVALATRGVNLYAGTYSGTFLSTDNGTNWTSFSTGLPVNETVNCFEVDGDTVFAGTLGNGVYFSVSNGSWNQISNGLTTLEVGDIQVSGSNLFAATNGGGVFLSTDRGANWTPVNNGLGTPYVEALAVIGTNLFAGLSGAGAYRSTNNGASWMPINNGLDGDARYIWTFTAISANLFAGTQIGVYLTTNNGSEWTQVSNGIAPPRLINSIVYSGANLFAGTYGIYHSTNSGGYWTAVNTGLGTPLYTRALALSNLYLFAGAGQDSGAWRRPLSQLTYAGEDQGGLSPRDFVLGQNYPNPFNPSTVISIQLPVYSFVNLRFYDVLGREVANLVNEETNSGRYEVTWDATGFASGVYFYRLQAGSFVSTRKMVLMK